MSPKPSQHLHIYFVLDRSGSMESMASDVVGGFNSFLATQVADGDDAVMTLVQFDSQDPHEILAKATRLSDVPKLTAATFVPRGGTPLYDAMGHTIADATIHAERRRAAGDPDEAILFVTFTDGEENQSTEYTKDKLFELVKKREADGWVFAYLGANQDSYAEGGQIGYTAGNTQNFAADSQGAQAAFKSLTGSVQRHRAAMRAGMAPSPAGLFEGDKSAEEDLNRRSRS